MRKRRILITGATSGIGFETAKALADDSHELILASRDPAKSAACMEAILAERPGASLRSYVLDLSSLECIRAFAESLGRDYDSLDVLFNNAGLFMDRPGKTVEGFETTIGVNYIGTWYLTRSLLDLLSKGKNPQIINVNSRAALFGSYRDREEVFENHPPGFRAYSASKLMQLLMTRRLAYELAGRISVNAIHPGHVATGIWKGETPILKVLARVSARRHDPPEKAARVGLYLIENEGLWRETGKFFERLGEVIPLPPRFSDRALMDALERRTLEAIAGRAGVGEGIENLAKKGDAAGHACPR